MLPIDTDSQFIRDKSISYIVSRYHITEERAREYFDRSSGISINIPYGSAVEPFTVKDILKKLMEENRQSAQQNIPTQTGFSFSRQLITEFARFFIYQDLALSALNKYYDHYFIYYQGLLGMIIGTLAECISSESHPPPYVIEPMPHEISIAQIIFLGFLRKQDLWDKICDPDATHLTQPSGSSDAAREESEKWLESATMWKEYGKQHKERASSSECLAQISQDIARASHERSQKCQPYKAQCEEYTRHCYESYHACYLVLSPLLYAVTQENAELVAIMFFGLCREFNLWESKDKLTQAALAIDNRAPKEVKPKRLVIQRDSPFLASAHTVPALHPSASTGTPSPGQ